MQNVPTISMIILYVLLVLFGLYLFVLLYWQIMVFKGKRMKNIDGSYDDWKENNTDYGFSFADIVISCPIGLVGVVLSFFHFQIGFYIMAMISFWFLWVNIGTTAISLKFKNPKLNAGWFFSFPFGSIMGLGFIVWSIVYYEVIFNSRIFDVVG